MIQRRAVVWTVTLSVLAIGLGYLANEGLFGRSDENNAPLATEYNAAIDKAIPIKSTDAQVPAEPTKMELASIRAELTELRSTLSSLSLLVKARGIASGETGLESPMEADATLSPDEVTDAEPSSPQQPEDISARFENETVDVAWSAKATDAIHNAVAEEASDSVSLGQVECRSSVCRVEIEPLDPEARDAFLEKLPALLGDTFRGFSAQYKQDEPDGLTILELDAGDQRAM